ncbi:MAG: 4Fe-4S dicluster domain-containing protein [candidate division WOR-3 bacterium]|nr:4Fe-4S dicluster domain-containing protein [candidate division WOR-3 bacterium]
MPLVPRFKYEVATEPGGENIKLCFACGICTASCPIREVDNRYNPRKIIRMVLLGMKDRILKSDFIWLCSSCYACSERCPQGVRFTEVMNAIKNLAVKAGFVHPAYLLQVGIIKKFGRLYEIDSFDNNKRTSLGLPVVAKAKMFTAKISALTGLDDILNKIKGHAA